MPPRLTIAICLIAAVTEAVLGCTSTAGLTAGDAVILPFVIGPYLLLALLAWTNRRHVTVSRVLLAAAASLAVWGLYVAGMDSYRYHTEPDYRLVQRMDVFVVALARWVAVALVGVCLLVRGRHRPSRSP